MLVESSEILAKLALFVDREILLITEEHYAAGGNEESDVILLSVCEIGEVNTADFCSNFWIIVLERGGNFFEIIVGWRSKECFIGI